MKNVETTAPQKEQKELSNREKQHQRLLEATATAKSIKASFVNNAKSLEELFYYNHLPLNYYILNHVYKSDGITEFKKFGEWKNENATIRKGAKAYPIWGQPIAKQKQEEAEKKGEEYEPSMEEMRHFPMCYVFSNLQVIFDKQA